jgi:hypothetical protein
MPLSLGIVGLPNVGKSTLFNALTQAQNAEAANYPFCTIEPNRAIVPVPDPRLEAIAAIVKPARLVHATVEFVDIAGLVRGASRGEGLGNQFLGNIRETSAIVHIVRCFEDDNVVHVHGAIDPLADIDVINTELILADLQTLEKRIERLAKQVKVDRKLAPLIPVAEALKAHLEAGRPIVTFPGHDDDAFVQLNADLHFLSDKPAIYAANVDDDGLAGDDDHVRAVRKFATDQGMEFVKICAQLEQEMAGMSDEERHELLGTVGVTESGLEKIIHTGYRELGLISYFTAGPKEARAWTIRRGARVPQAAGEIHSDFERGFIRAEVIDYDEFIANKGEAGAKAAGKMRLEGKEYVVQDGDVVLFRFSV